MLAFFATDASMCFVDDNQGWTGAGELGAAAVGLDVVEADDSVGICFEQALRGRQSPLETTRFGSCDGDSIDVELLREFRDPLIHEMRRAKYRKAIDNPAIEHLPDDNAGFDRLSDADVVGNQ